MSEQVNDRGDVTEADPPVLSGLSRRGFVGAMGVAAVGGLLAACSGDDDDGGVATDDGGTTAVTTGDTDLDDALQASDLPDIEWDMATSWPIVLDTIYGGAEFFGQRVAALTGGRFKITAAPGGELVPALEILQSVQTGAVSVRPYGVVLLHGHRSDHAAQHVRAVRHERPRPHLVDDRGRRPRPDPGRVP